MTRFPVVQANSKTIQAFSPKVLVTYVFWQGAAMHERSQEVEVFRKGLILPAAKNILPSEP